MAKNTITKNVSEVKETQETKAKVQKDFLVIEHKKDKLISYAHRSEINLDHSSIKLVSEWETELQAIEAAKVYSKANKKRCQY